MKITVFTPTYNRGYIIENLYRSLQKQTYTNFEWLVINDGSDDNTSFQFDKWKKENNDFLIRYYYVKNGGKHRAINKATELAGGELFFIVDSDDSLTEDALESIIKWEETIQKKEKFCGISGNRGKNKNEIWGTTFEGEFIDATSLDRIKYNIVGDKAEVFYTNVLKNYKFEEFEGENFITERTVWDRMANDGYKIRWFNKIIYLSNYLEDGLTKSGDNLFAKNPQGTATLVRQQIKFYNLNLKEKMSQYNAYYNLVKNTIGFRKSAKYLNIHITTMFISVFLIKCKNLLLITKKN